MSVTETERNYKEFKKLRKQGLLIGEAAKKLGLNRQTGGRYEKRLRAEPLPKAVAHLEKRILQMSQNPEYSINDLVKLADALSKIKACE